MDSNEALIKAMELLQTTCKMLQAECATLRSECEVWRRKYYESLQAEEDLRRLVAEACSDKAGPVERTAINLTPRD